MPNQVSVENNFIGGLKTEFTGLNFPENACTATSNCVFSLIGDVLRREGINYEANNVLNAIDTTNAGAGTSISSYRWKNAGGDGLSQILVLQVGSTLYFFYTSAATAASPISAQLLTPTVNLTTYQATGSVADPSQIECQFSDGNGYLFVFHQNCDPFYVQFIPPPTGPAISSSVITVQIRDFFGVNPEPGAPSFNFRPSTLTNEHSYNLQNQGWTNNVTWTTSSTTPNLSVVGNNFEFNPLGSFTFTVASGLTIGLGTQVNITWTASYVFQSPGDGNYGSTTSGSATGNVTAYAGTSLTINIVGQNPGGFGGNLVSGPNNQSFSISSSNLINTIATWNTQIGNYPSNSDIWWEFKDAGTLSGENGVPTFNPAVTIAQVPSSQSQGPQGHFILNAFRQQRSSASGVPGITDIITQKRPRAGCWFAGRIWYSGLDDSQPATGDEPFYTWTENIYFSQIVTGIQDFGLCYQVNDPTDDRLTDLLPSDGGVIVIQGSGSIHKLFPIQNGILVFADNGIWLITGDGGLGFTADSYTITKLSSVRTISSKSFIDVNGLPFFWNEEGIYAVQQGKDNIPYGHGGFVVEPLTVGTILTYYNNIPFDSKRYARGYYDPISYVVSWVFRSTQESGINNRYQFDTSLNLNVFNRAFYPYTFGNNGSCFVNGIVYMDYPSGSLEAQFKYLTAVGTQFTFSEENDATTWLDFFSFDSIGVDYPSNFTTGYKVAGTAYKKWDPLYLVVYSNDSINNSYTIQGIWDFATTNLGRTTNIQVITNPQAITYASGLTQAPPGGFGFTYRRHKIRGHGQALQFNFASVVGQPFHIIGWAIPEHINIGA